MDERKGVRYQSVQVESKTLNLGISSTLGWISKVDASWVVEEDITDATLRYMQEILNTSV